jgi:hypothetical protein
VHWIRLIQNRHNENDNEILSSIKGGEFFDLLDDY